MKTALIQMDSKFSEIDENIKTASRLIDDAAKQGAKIILLPEYWSTAFFPATRDYKCYELAAPDTGPSITAMREKAVEHKLHIIATIFEQDGSDLFYDTAMLIDPDGNIIGKYRKTHIGGERHIVIDGKLNTDLGIASIYFRTGSLYPVFRIGEWNVGIILCYDTYFPEAARCLTLAGAEVIMAPFGISDTKDTIWKELLAELSAALKRVAGYSRRTWIDNSVCAGVVQHCPLCVGKNQQGPHRIEEKACRHLG